MHYRWLKYVLTSVAQKRHSTPFMSQESVVTEKLDSLFSTLLRMSRSKQGKTPFGPQIIPSSAEEKPIAHSQSLDSLLLNTQSSK